MADDLTITEAKDDTYVLQETDLIPVVKAADESAVSVTPAQLNPFVPYETKVLSADASNFSFTIPADAKLVKFDGMLIAEAVSAIRPAIRVNSLSTAIYDYTLFDFTATADGQERTAQNEIIYTSSWSSDEHVILEMTIDVVGPNDRHAFKSSTFNTGGSGDFHICGGYVALAGLISSVDFLTISPFANDYATGTYITMSVMR